MISAEITKKCYSAQTALLIAAAAGAILVEICCPMQVTAAGRTSGPQGARGTPPLMRPVGFVCARVVRKSAGLGAFWCGRRPHAHAQYAHIMFLTLSGLSCARRPDLSSACGATCGEKGGINTRRPFAPGRPLPSLAIIFTLQIGRQPPATPPRYEYATTMLTPVCAPSGRASSRGLFDADAAPPTL